MLELMPAIGRGRWALWLLLTAATIALIMVLRSAAAHAQSPTIRQVQQVEGKIELGSSDWYLIPALKQGQTLYVYMEGTTGNLDPFIALGDSTLRPEGLRDQFVAAVEEAVEAGRDPLLALPPIADEVFLAWDDDSGQGYAAALKYEIAADGDYLLTVFAGPFTSSFGEYRLLLGIDAPAVRSGEARPTGDEIATYLARISQANFGVDTVAGTFTETRRSTFYGLEDLAPGDSLYAYIQTTAGNLIPQLVLEDFGGKPLRSGEYTAQQTVAKLEYTFPNGGSNYRLVVSACCGDDPVTTGEYRLLVGRNAPEVLTGLAAQGGSPVLDVPIDVEVGVKLQQITGVDQKAENFGAVASLRLEWRDPELAFSPDECNCSFQLYQGDDFAGVAAANEINWPIFTLLNQQGNRWTQNKNVVVFPNGSATYLERFSTSFQAPDFDFTLFPFDTQQFYIRVDSIFPVEYFTYSSDSEFNEVGTQLGEEEWYITDWNTGITTVQESTESLTSRFSFGFQARRHLEFYIFRILVPLLLIITVAWITFFLQDYGKRVDATTANLLLFIAFNFTISNDLPRLGYLTYLDALLAATFIFSVLVVAYNVYLKRQEIKGREGRAKRVDKYMIWLYPLGYAIAFGAMTYLYFVAGIRL